MGWQDAKHLFDIGHYEHALTAFEFVVEISKLGKKDQNFREICGEPGVARVHANLLLPPICKAYSCGRSDALGMMTGSADHAREYLAKCKHILAKQEGIAHEPMRARDAVRPSLVHVYLAIAEPHKGIL